MKAVANIAAQLEWAASGSDEVDRVHRFAMAAKECTFTAQDALALAWNDRGQRATGRQPGTRRKRETLLRKLERRLARVRAELEQLDTDYRAAGRSDDGR
jgi:hypothetical protein